MSRHRLLYSLISYCAKIGNPLLAHLAIDHVVNRIVQIFSPLEQLNSIQLKVGMTVPYGILHI